jgi:hypothetical protein
VTGPYPSAGRYAYTRNDINVLTSIRRNPYWTHGSPGQLDGVDIRWNQDPNTVVGEVEAGRLDEVAGVPAAQRQSLGDRYGVGNGRFPCPAVGVHRLRRAERPEPGAPEQPSAAQSDRLLVDRTAYAGSAGPFGATPWTHLVPSGTVQP